MKNVSPYCMVTVVGKQILQKQHQHKGQKGQRENYPLVEKKKKENKMSRWEKKKKKSSKQANKA